MFKKDTLDKNYPKSRLRFFRLLSLQRESPIVLILPSVNALELYNKNQGFI